MGRAAGVSITEEGEPGEEGGGAEAEQRQQQHDQVQGDGAGFTPPVSKGADVRGRVATVGQEKHSVGGVPSPVAVRERTDDCGTHQRGQNLLSELRLQDTSTFRSAALPQLPQHHNNNPMESCRC